MNEIEIYYFFKLLSLKGIGPVFLNKFIHSINYPNKKIDYLIKNEIDILEKYFNESQLESLKKFDQSLMDQINKLLEIGASFVNITQPEYPIKIKNTLKYLSPPILTFKGNFNLINNISVGFCGSRKASEKGISVAKDCTKQLTEKEINIVSGYASGIDQITHYTALESGGKTIIVLPEGLLHFRIKSKLKDVWDWRRVLVISEFLPNTSWTTSRAMTRNNTIIGVSDAMILVEARENGGSIDAGRKTLKFNKKLFAPVYEGMPEFAIGNKILIKQGAIEIKRNKKTKKANLEKLFKFLKDSKYLNNEKQLKIAF